LVYATGSFICTDLDDFYLHSQTQNLTVLRHEPSFVSKGLTIGRLEGVLQVPNTVFTIRIVWPTDPSDILSTTAFTVDAATTIGAPNQTTLLSDAIIIKRPSGTFYLKEKKTLLSLPLIWLLVASRPV